MKTTELEKEVCFWYKVAQNDKEKIKKGIDCLTFPEWHECHQCNGIYNPKRQCAYVPEK